MYHESARCFLHGPEVDFFGFTLDWLGSILLDDWCMVGSIWAAHKA